MQKNRRKGFTLTEMAIVLGALGLLVGAIWAIVGVVWDSYRVNKVREDLFQVVQNIQGHYAHRSSVPAGDITSIVDGFGLIPVTMRSDRTSTNSPINHEFASSATGTFLVEGVGCPVTGSNTCFKTTLFQLNQEACQKMLMQFPLLLPELGVRQVQAQTGGVVNIDPHDLATPSAEASLPFSVSDAVARCSDPSNNTVRYVFTIRP